MADSSVSTAPLTALPEAPVSWNVRYTSSQGYDCQLTLRGLDAAEVLRTANEIMTRMQAAGVPGQAPRARLANQAPEESPATVESDPSWCPIHGVAMRLHERDGQRWYSHKTEAGDWCKGRLPRRSAPQ